jgi:hypothetical protein
VACEQSLDKLDRETATEIVEMARIAGEGTPGH